MSVNSVLTPNLTCQDKNPSPPSDILKICKQIEDKRTEIIILARRLSLLKKSPELRAAFESLDRLRAELEAL